MKNPEVFEGLQFQDLMKEIHGHAGNKRSEIKTLMDTLAGMISKPQDAAIIAPLVREFMEVAVKNDEHLVKMATIMQRLMAADVQGGGGSLESFLTEDEKSALLEEAKHIKDAASADAADELSLAIDETQEVEELAKKAKKAIAKVKHGANQTTK